MGEGLAFYALATLGANGDVPVDEYALLFRLVPFYVRDEGSA